MRNKKPNRLLCFFGKKHYGAYVRMIDELRPLLMNPNLDCWSVEQLQFRTDLDRGSRKLIWQAIARLLSAAPDGQVFARGYRATDLFRWLSDDIHCNLNANFQSLQRLVYLSFYQPAPF